MLTLNLRRAAVPAALLACALLAGASRADDWKLDSDTFEGLRARALGPGVMGGRVTCIDGVPGSRLTLWVGAAGGGVWRSKDGATTWSPVFDEHTMSIGAIRVSPADPKVVWVGTGESWTRNSVGVGDGVWKTTDGGDQWKKMGLENTERIARIVVNPEHPDTVLVAATGPLFADSPERGVFRTRDGGRTWAKVLYVDAGTGAADLAMDPQDPNTLYASMWTFRRRPWTFSSGGPGSGLYKSTDGGSTWRRLTDGLPAGELGRICVTVSPARASRVYAVVESKSTAFYRSDDCGEHWTRLNDSNANVTWRPFYFANLVADPVHIDRVYKGGLTLSVSDDAGRTFGGGGGGSSFHSDVHALWIDPKNPDWMILGCDGGCYVSQDRAATWRAVQNMPVGQFYHVSVDDQNPYNVYGGLQDNGTWRGPTRSSGGVSNRMWTNLNGGDGMWAFVDPRDADVLYSEYQGGEISRTVMSTGETKSIMPSRLEGGPKLRFNWNTPIHVGPASGALYMGAQSLYRSRDRGDRWESISPDLTTNDPLKQRQDQSGGLSVDNSAAENHCTIYAIAESPRDSNVVWAGTDDGNLQLTRDGGRTWTNLTASLPGLPRSTWISSVCASPHDAATCFVTADGHMLGDLAPHAFVTRDFGRTWQPMTAGLRGYCHVVKQDLVNPDLVFVGSEFGLFCSLDGGKAFAQIRSGIPDVAVRDLAIQPREGDLLIATHGRGIFVLDDLTPLRGLTAKTLGSDAAFLPSRPSVLFIPSGQQRFDGDADWSADNLPESAVLTYYLRKRHLIGDLKVEVLDADGRVLQTLAGSRRRGLNRVEWPMRLKGPKIPPAANLVPNFFAFVGPRAPAGTYGARLIRNRDTVSTRFTLVPDPRSTHTAADRAAQVVLVRRLYDRLNDLSWTTETVLALRDTARARAAGLGKGDALATRLRAFADRLEAFRGTIVAAREGGRLTGEIRLREELGDLYGKVNGYDGRPTDSQVNSGSRIEGEIRKAQSELDGILTRELPGLNASLGGHHLAPLAREARADWDARQKKG